ncbi:hypothetical protein [Haliangium sp.]|uniref:hypothetical protein n=1 Tax=Haliangium sp. TaxID=2663208 RepID=UPI003D0EBE30
MKSSQIWIAGLVVAAGALVTTYLLWPNEPGAGASANAQSGAASMRAPVRPSEPPVPGRDEPPRTPTPEAPPMDIAALAAVYDQAKAAGDPQPGEKAFRANLDAFMKYNRAFAEDQARAEGLTVEEVGELTYLGFFVQRTQVWPEVEELLGSELSPEQREAGEQLMHDMNREFKAAMRALVADGADEDERWALIRATQERYRKQYYQLTGMTPALVDDLLAGDLSRKYAPSVTPPPEDIGENPDYAPPQSRPEVDPESIMGPSDEGEPVGE